ncbi:MAG: DUF4397 domain-containing protein [Gemmatimonadota bacterium]
MRTSRSILMLLLTVAMLPACDKTAVGVIDDPAAGNGANVKFFNFSVGSPQVNFYVNDKKVTGISTTGCAVLDDDNREQCLSSGLESASGVAYGSAGNGANAWYSDVAPGQATISGKIAATTDKNLAIANLQTNVETGKFYSYYLSGIYNTTAKTSDAFIVEDVMPPEDFTVAYVRFVNGSSTTQPMTLYVKNRTTLEEVAVGGLVNYKSGGAFTAVPVGVSYDLSTRTSGSSTNVFSRLQVTFSAGRAYTITARGNTATASTMLLDNTANR